MAEIHTVVQGEHISALAAKYGFADYLVIWNHSDNAELRTKRSNPNVLLPGDQLTIPDRQTRNVSVATGAIYNFQVRLQKLNLRFTLLDVDGEPIAAKACELTVDGQVWSLTSDAQGRIDVEVPRTARGGMLVLDNAQVPLKIGYLDPVNEISGVQARLSNLGYYRGPQNPVDEMELLSAIEEFQCDYGLTVTGVCDTPTLGKLLEAHGC